MPVITGLIDNAAGFPIALGRITVQLRQPLIDRSTTPDALLTTLPQAYTITNGVLNSPAVAGTTLGQISLPATANEQVSYRFTIELTTQTTRWFLNDGAEYPDSAPRVQNTGKWYTGATFVQGESREITSVVETTFTPIVDPFDAILPDMPTIEIVDLVDFGAEFVSNPQAGLSYLAQLVTTDTQYLNKLRAGRWTGPYSAATVYQFGDIVSYGSPQQAWISKNSSASTKMAPPETGTVGNADWDYSPMVNVTNPSVNISNLVQKSGDTMTGNLILPAPGATPPNTIALREAEANNLYVRLAAVAQTIQGVKTFTGGAIVPDQAASDSSGNAANTKFVSTFWGANRYDKMCVFAARDTAQSLSFNVMNKITFNNIVVNVNEGGAYYDGAGVFTIRTAGWHRILVTMEYNNTTGAQAGGILQIKQTTAPVTNFKIAQAANYMQSAPSSLILSGTALINFVGGSQFEVQFQPQSGSGAHTIVGDANTTRVYVFRQLV